MVYQNFEEWRDSNEGPSYYELLSEGDLRDAFDAGVDLGTEKAVTKDEVLRVINIHTLGMYRPSVVKLRRRIEELFDQGREDERAEKDNGDDQPFEV